MTEIRLTPSATGAELMRAGSVMSWRYLGRLGSLGSLLAIIAGGILMSLLGGAVVAAPLNHALLIGFYASLGAVGTILVVNWLIGRRLARDHDSTDWRRKDLVMVLERDGIAIEARRLPWSDVSGVARVRESTMLLFSAVDGMLIPDRDLPQGLTPVDLHKQIAAWREGKA